MNVPIVQSERPHSSSKIDELIEYLDKYENLFCIGRNGQHRYNNMDHSMVTAMETVRNITLGIKGKDNIWNVNTDKKYHEETTPNEKKLKVRRHILVSK